MDARRSPDAWTSVRNLVVPIVLAGFVLAGGQVWAQGGPALNGKLIASDGIVGDNFGAAVAISGNTAVVAAPGMQPAGAAYVFERAPGGDAWTEVTKLTSGTTDAGFGSSVSIDGDVIVVGASGQNATYLFGRNEGGPGAWGLITTLTPSDAALGQVDGFGASVSISVDTVVVGAPISHVAHIPGGVGLLGPGAAYIFERDHPGPGGWGEVARIVGECPPLHPTPCDPDYLDLFGGSVGVSGHTVVVGSAGERVPQGPGSSAAYLFDRDRGGPGQWGRLRLAVPHHLWDMPSSSRVAISGDTAMAGPVGPEGVVAFFERNQGGPEAWGLVAIRSAKGGFSDGASPDVAIDGDLAIISELSDSGLNSAAVFSRNRGGPSHWGFLTSVRASDLSTGGRSNRFAQRVAIDRQTVLVSSAEASGNAVASYACRVDDPNDPESACELASVVNSLISVTAMSTECCGPDPAAPVFTITATFKSSEGGSISAFEVVELTEGAVLLNADNGPGGVGATLSPFPPTGTPPSPFTGDIFEYVLGEVTVRFEIGLQRLAPFRFVINVVGPSNR